MVGIIIVGVLSVIPCFVGYNLVHYYERYAWTIIFIIILFLWGLGGHAGYDINAQKPLEDTGRALSADILSFGGIVFGSVSGVRVVLPGLCVSSGLTFSTSVGTRRGGLQLQAAGGHL